MEISDNLLCVFTARVEERDGAAVITVPENEQSLGDVRAGKTYQVALVDPNAGASSTPRPAAKRERDVPAPPVKEGERRDVEIEDTGEQGDGIARVERGFVVIVPDTEMNERVTVEITEVRENVAFAEVVERHDVR